MPTTAVEEVEVIAPVEIEIFLLGAPLVNLNVVVQYVPGHISSFKFFTPRVEGRSPEVHSERLRLIEVTNCWVSQVGVAHSVTIDGPTHIGWGPLKLVGVPVVVRVETMGVVVRLNLIMAVAVNQIH